MKFCIISTVVTIIASSFIPALFWLCIPLIVAYVIFSLGSFFRGEIGKGFLIAALCPTLPLLSVLGMALIHS